jgi:glutamate-1-semialdehyde aminotransferase
MSRTQELYARGRQRIPGGTQLLSKRPELYLPEQWPAYFRRARGVEIEDLDGRRYIDVSNHSVGACPLGYADPEVNAAVVAVVDSGNISSLNPPEEVELAERLCALHPWAGRARFARGGGEAMAIAVRLARAATGRDTVVFSGYHGWHDWYLAANLADRSALDGHLLPQLDPAGVPAALAGSIVPVPWGDAAGIEAALAAHGPRVAAVVLEPARYHVPPAEYLLRARSACTRAGAALVIDEITTGFRLAHGGAHLLAGVEPDLAVFAKAMSNGYPMAAVIGRAEVMDAALRSFVSSTYWSERIGPAAALATIAKLRREDAPARLAAAGARMRTAWEQCAARHGLRIATTGIAAMPRFSFQHGDDSPYLAALFTQTMLDAGYLASGAFYATLAHDAAVLDAARAAVDASFAALAHALAGGTLRTALRGPLPEAGMRRSPAPKGAA